MPKAKQLPSGNWRCRAAVTDQSGKLIRRSFTADTARKAEAAALAWQADETRQIAGVDLTVGEAIDRYIASKEGILSVSTIREYERMRKKTMQSLMLYKLDRLTPEMVQATFTAEGKAKSDRTKKPKSAKTLKNEYRLLCSAVQMFRPAFNVNVTFPQQKEKEGYMPTDADIQRLLKYVEGTDWEIPILLAAFGPMRRGEICAVTSDDVDGSRITVGKAVALDKNGEWITKSPKTAAGYRVIDYPDFVIRKLWGVKGPLCKLSPATLSNDFARLLRYAGVPPFRFHALRHWCASKLHANGMPDAYIMKRGGWSSQAVLDRVYRHALRDERSAFDGAANAAFSKSFGITGHKNGHKKPKLTVL